MKLPVADLVHRDSGTYPKPQNCLTCGKPIDAEAPHIFVRDADQSLNADDALVGLLHNACEQRYLEAAKASGIRPPSSE